MTVLKEVLHCELRIDFLKIKIQIYFIIKALPYGHSEVNPFIKNLKLEE